MKIDCEFPWRTQPLSQIITNTVSGVSLGDNDFADNGFPVAHKGDVRTNGILDLSPRNSRYVSGKSFELNKRAQVTNEYLVVSLRDLVPAAPQLGLINKLPEDQSCVLLAQGTYGFKVDPKQLDMTFLSQLSSADFFRSTMKKNAVGSTQKHLRSTEFFELEVPVPPIDEQEKIAKILSTWDEAIEMLESQKSGIERILDFSLLRLSKELCNAKNRYFKLGEVLSKVSNGMTYNSKESFEGGVPITRIETISNGKIDLKKVGLVDPELVNDSYLLERGDILLSHINSIDHIGKTAYFDDDTRLLHGMNLLLLRANAEIDSRFLFHVLRTPKAKKFFASHAKKAVNQASINTGELAGFSFYLPLKSHQLIISEQIYNIEKVLELLVLKVNLFKAQKQGLMQQLLTGKKRVKVD